MPSALKILSRSFRELTLTLAAQDRIACPKCNPISMGVYVLTLANRIVYVGSSVNVYARIMAHCSDARRQTGSGAIRKQFDGALVLPLPRCVLKSYEGALIRALRPPYNASTPGDGTHDAEILYGLGLSSTLPEDGIDWQEVA